MEHQIFSALPRRNSVVVPLVKSNDIQTHKNNAHTFDVATFFSSIPLRFSMAVLACLHFVILVALAGSEATLEAHEIVGAVLSSLSCAVVLGHAFYARDYIVHPNNLLLYKTLIDLAIAGWFLLVSTQKKDRCQILIVLTFLCVSAEGWMLCLAIDLLNTITSPFSSNKTNMKYYHLASWGLGLITAGISKLVDMKDWTQIAHNTSCSGTNSLAQAVWFYTLLLLIIVASIFICVKAVWRLRNGLSETFLMRANVAATSLGSFAIALGYWVLFYFFHAILLATKSTQLQRISVFLLLSGGMMDLMMWIVACHFRNFESSGNTPQANKALQTEFISYITSGIVTAFKQAANEQTTDTGSRKPRPVPLPQGTSHRVSFLELFRHRGHASLIANATPQAETASKNSSAQHVANDGPYNVEFFEIARESFRRVRACCSISCGVVEMELNTAVKPRFTEGGASGAVFFFSSNNRFIVKSVPKSEALFWLKMSHSVNKHDPPSTNAQAYAHYMETHPETYLTRVFGVFELKIYGSSFYIMMMDNIFRNARVTLHEVYDLKGSWVQRNAERPKEGEQVTCRHCNMRFSYSVRRTKREHCTKTMHHEPKKTFKDNDLKHRMRLTNPNQFIQQLEQDTYFLRDRFQTMDYSLLVGVHKQDRHVQTRPHWGRCLVAQHVLGPACFYVGIIDLLQEWTLKKKLERFLKMIWYRSESPGISAQPPHVYQARFMRAMRQYTNFKPTTGTASTDDLFDHLDLMDSDDSDGTDVPEGGFANASAYQASVRMSVMDEGGFMSPASVSNPFHSSFGSNRTTP